MWPFKKRISRKESQTAKVISYPGGTQTTWSPHGYDNFARETYLKNITAFKAIDEVAKSVAMVPWKQFQKLKDGNSDIVDDKDPISKILERPNPKESFPWIMLKTTAFLVMAGNGFLEKIGPETGPNKGSIKELYSHRPDRFKIVNRAGHITRYEYEVDGRKTYFDVDPVSGKSNLLHLKSFHPLDDWWGAAPTESAAREIDTSNAATEWNKSLLDNQGRPGMVFTLVGNVADEQVEQLERYLRERHGGPENVGKDLILTGENGTGASPYGWSPTDMDFGEGDLRLMRKISMGYGVPPELLGIESSTFNNRFEARTFFWENTVTWWLRYLKGELNNWFYGQEETDRFVNYVLDDIPAFSEKRNKLWERAQSSNFLSINEKREMVGMDSWGDDGDVILIEASKIPLGMSTEENETEETEKEKRKKELEEAGYSEEEIEDLIGYDDDDYIDAEFEDDKDDDNCEIDFDYDPVEDKPFPSEWACRLNPPGKYEKFTRINCYRRSAGKCIDYIFGILKGKSEVQTLRYKKKIWSKEAAQTHCEKRGGSFE